MKDVSVTFSCGHTGLVTASLFQEGEKVVAPCRECRPSRIVPLFRLGAIAAFGALIYGIVLVNELAVLGSVIGLGAVAFFLLILR